MFFSLQMIAVRTTILISAHVNAVAVVPFSTSACFDACQVPVGGTLFAAELAFLLRCNSGSQLKVGSVLAAPG